jgi:phenylpropionate dioxygenase-like ring-hydroxylating dioxygenase large terminal subunit
MATSAELTDQPLKVRAMGLDFVVFRDTQGKANCLANVCTHRGGNLAGGKIKGDCIQCPYHGWQFDGEGIRWRSATVSSSPSSATSPPTSAPPCLK